MKKTLIGMLSIMLVFALISTSLFSATDELPDDDELPTRGSRGYAQANDIKVEVPGDTGEFYNLAGIGSNASGYHLYENRSYTHQWFSSDSNSFYDTVWHPDKQYSLVVGANHSWAGSSPSNWMASIYKFEGATYTDLLNLSIFDDGDWLKGVDFRPQGDYALIVGDWGLVVKYFDSNSSFQVVLDTNNSANYFYDVEFYQNGTEALIVGYDVVAGNGAIWKYNASNNTVWKFSDDASWNCLSCVSINSDDVAVIGGWGGEMINYNTSNATVSMIADTNIPFEGCDWNRAGTNATFVGDGSIIETTNGSTNWTYQWYDENNRTLYDCAWNRNDSYALLVGEDAWASEFNGTLNINVTSNITNITFFCVNFVCVNLTYTNIYQYISTVIIAQVSVSSGSKAGIGVNYTVERLGVVLRSGNGTTDSFGNMMWEWDTALPSPYVYTVRVWVRQNSVIVNTTHVSIFPNPGVLIHYQNAPESQQSNEWTCEMQLFSNTSMYVTQNANFTMKHLKYVNRSYSTLYTKNTAVDEWGHYVMYNGRTLSSSTYGLNKYYLVEVDLYNHTASGYGEDDVVIDLNGTSGSPMSDRGGDDDLGPNGTYRPLSMETNHLWFYTDNNSNGKYDVTDSYTEPLCAWDLIIISYIVGYSEAWIPLSSATNWPSIYWNDNASDLVWSDGEDIYLDDGDGKLNANASLVGDDEGFTGTPFMRTYHCFKVTTPATLSRSESVSVNLTSGWNLIGMPQGMTTATLSAKSTHIYSIVHRTAGGSSGYYITYTKAVGVTSFTMTKFEGVYIYTNQTCTITFTETIT